MSHSLRVLSLLVAVACPAHALAPDKKSSEPPTRPQSAPLVVDAQVGVWASIWESQRVIGHFEQLVAKARAAGVPVIWVQHADDDELQHGSEPWKLAPNFVPTTAEMVMHKKYNSSFASTDLDQRLKALGVSRIVLAGALTNWCLRSTACGAVDRSYHLALVSDAHSTESLKLPDGKTVAAEAIVADLNAVFAWVSAPNGRTEVKETADAAF